MGPPQRDQEYRVRQGVRPSQRRCLLKGCERTYRPAYPLSRYCGPACRQAARRWSLYRANRRYRATDGGKARRRSQCRRYRRRIRESQRPDQSPCAGGEGYHKACCSEDFLCRRPGCYVWFRRSRRSPLQKFCSSSCRQALRRVLIRERRWRKLTAMTPIKPWRQHDRW